MPVDLDAVLGVCQGVFGHGAIVTPIRSAPRAPAFPVRGIYALEGRDDISPDGLVVRMDNYTFSVRLSELPSQVGRGDLVSSIDLPFLQGLTFEIDDTGDDGQGAQKWVLKARNIRTQGQ